MDFGALKDLTPKVFNVRFGDYRMKKFRGSIANLPKNMIFDEIFGK